MPDFYLYLSAEINATSTNSLIQYMGSLIGQNPNRLTIAMNSPGGNVVSGFATYNAMLAMPYPITTHNIGNVDSIANVVFLGGRDRYACPASTFMFHGVGFQEMQTRGTNPTILKGMLDTVLSDHRRISGTFAVRTNGGVTVRSGMNLFKEQRTRGPRSIGCSMPAATWIMRGTYSQRQSGLLGQTSIPSIVVHVAAGCDGTD